jgi:hypothetical protein
VFSFTGLNEMKDAKLEFRLIRHIATIGKDEQLETVTVEVEVVEYKKNSIVNDYVKYSENSATLPTGNDDCSQVLKYGYPPYMKYGYAPTAGTGADCPIVQDERGCLVFKYGYPGPFVKYGYYGAEGAKAGCAVVQDDYGRPVVKYGCLPLVKYGYSGCQS